MTMSGGIAMTIRTLIGKELRHLQWVIITGLLLSAGVAVVTVVTFHYIGQVVEELPSELTELLAAYEVTRQLVAIFSDYSIYIWSQWNAKNLYQLATLFAIIIAAVQFAGEVNSKTIGFYLTRPITRKEGYLGKVTAGLLVLLLIFGGGTVFIWVTSLIMGYAAEWGRLFTALLISLAWAAVYYLLACIISTLNREPILAGVIIGISGVLLSLPGMFVITRQYSIFYQMRAADYFVAGAPAALPLLFGLLLSGLFVLIGLYIFDRRDF